MAKTYKFNRYVAEAKSEPFVLEVDEDTQISIDAPSGDTIMLIEESGSSRRTLELLCGEQFDAVFDLIKDQPGSVLNGLAADMAKHFGLAAPPAGGTGASSR